MPHSTIPGLGLQGKNRELEAAAGLGIKRFLLLDEGIENGDWRRLINLIPDVRLAVRFYHPDMMSLHPQGAAMRGLEMIVRYVDSEFQRHIVAVIPANELNLDVEHGHASEQGIWRTEDSYAQIDAWLVKWAETWKGRAARLPALRPEMWWPGLSPGLHPPNSEAESEYDLLTQSLDAYNAWNVHAYGGVSGDQLRRAVGKLRSLGIKRKPIHVTEVNRVPFVEFLHICTYHKVESAFWFLWRGNPEHAALDLRPPYTKGLREYIEEIDMTDTPTIEDYLTDMWRRQGVDPNKDNDVMWQYALHTAMDEGRVIVPLPSLDGNYQNFDHPQIVVGYTTPISLWTIKDIWHVFEGLPPKAVA